MKNSSTISALFAIVFSLTSCAQNRTVVSSTNAEISDNLDLTAVSSIFGESANLNDFERRLNDPQLQISNLDLNYDNRVDYLRVIESVENNTHVVVIQSVLGRDQFQDVATIEIEKTVQNRFTVQIVGNAYIYGQNYIYEPVYYSTPRIYASFSVNLYRPYVSSWTWGYYPSYYIAWNPYPVYRYRQNIYGCINYHNTYTYVNYRKCYRAPVIYNRYSCNSYERQYPQQSFSHRNSYYSNRYEMDQRRNNGKSDYASKHNYGSNNAYGNQRNNYSTNENNRRNNSNHDINGQRAVYSPKTEGNNSRGESHNQRLYSREENQGNYNRAQVNNQRVYSNSREENQGDYNRTQANRAVFSPRTESKKEDHQSNYRQDSRREANNARVQQSRDYHKNAADSRREANNSRAQQSRNQVDSPRSERQSGLVYSNKGMNRRF